jgi:hypothetical protein
MPWIHVVTPFLKYLPRGLCESPGPISILIIDSVLTIVRCPGNTFIIGYGDSLISLSVMAHTLSGIGSHEANFVDVEDLLLLVRLFAFIITLVCPHRGLVHQHSCNDP